jgi:hypothetical protein
MNNVIQTPLRARSHEEHQKEFMDYLQNQAGLNSVKQINPNRCQPGGEPSAIEQVVCRLSDVLNDLSIRVEKLTTKLDPILTPIRTAESPMKDPNCKDCPTPISTLACRLTSLYGQACHITNELEQLQGRVEL